MARTLDLQQREPAGAVAAAAERARAWRDAHPRVERVAIAVVLAAAWTVGYQLIGRAIDPRRAVSLRTPLDAAIPFVPETIFLYGLVYGAALYPLFVVRSLPLLRRAALAYALVIGGSLLCFGLFPVTCAGLRPPLAAVDPRTLCGWGVRLVYDLDPPVNLFPSLHVGLAAIGALVAWRADRRAGALAVLIVLLTIVSITTVKQHYLVDAVAALLLVWLVHRRVLRDWTPPAGDGPLAYSWRGPAAYVVFQAGLYALCALAFAAGVRA
jgi:hypothetical protein